MRKYFSTKRIAYIAIFSAMSIVTNIFSLDFAFFANKVSIVHTVNALAGILIDPIAGLFVGFVGDTVGFLIKPSGAWLPLITLASALSGFIPGLLFKIKKIHPFIKIGISLALVYLICTVVLNSIAIYAVYIKGKKTFFAFLAGRLPAQTIVFLFNAVLIYLLYPVLSKAIKLHDVENTKTILSKIKESQQEDQTRIFESEKENIINNPEEIKSK